METGKQKLKRYAKSAFITFLSVTLSTIVLSSLMMLEAIAGGNEVVVTVSTIAAILLGGIVAGSRAVLKILSEPETMKQIISAVASLFKF